MAGYFMASACIFKFRSLFGADRLRVGTAGVETAAGRGRDGTGDVAFDAAFLLLPGNAGISDGNTAQKSFGIRVQGSAVDFICLTYLHQLSQVHNAHIIGNVADHGQIVGNEKIGNAPFLLKIL